MKMVFAFEEAFLYTVLTCMLLIMGIKRGLETRRVNFQRFLIVHGRRADNIEPYLYGLPTLLNVRNLHALIHFIYCSGIPFTAGMNSIYRLDCFLFPKMFSIFNSSFPYCFTISLPSAFSHQNPLPVHMSVSSPRKMKKISPSLHGDFSR